MEMFPIAASRVCLHAQNGSSFWKNYFLDHLRSTDMIGFAALVESDQS